MRRSRSSGQGSAFSLFPFLAVLLCTMGAMVVLLVAMAHVAREKAEREAEAEAEALASSDEVTRGRLAEERLAEARSYRDRLDGVRSDAAEKLREEQTRLSGIEDHIRRLQDELESLQVEELELLAVKEEHFEDRRAAEEELERQRELIENLKSEITELEQEAATRSRRYAIVPLRDQETGTSRPAVYFECREEGVVLQPEGITLSPEDFAPPMELSSPLAAALRAINQYYADHPEVRAANEAGAPYALLVVRPGGVEAYQRARAILESIDVDYGYQPVAADWPLEYEAAKPDLSERVAGAIHLARVEREQLSRAAPQLFQPQGFRGGWEWSDRHGDSQTPVAGQGGVAGDFALMGPAPSGVRSERSRQAEGQGGGYDSPGVGPVDASGHEAGLASSNSGEPPSEEPRDLANGDPQPAEGSPGGGASPTSSVAAAQAGGGSGSGGTPVVSPGGAASEATAGSPGGSPQAGATADGRRRNQRDGIAMRRTISVTVFDDRIVVLRQDAASLEEAVAESAYGDSVSLNGPTRSQSGAITAALRRHTMSWGIAGDGFYWKPRLRLHAAEGGSRRAAELAEAFRAAGIEVSPTTGTASAGGSSHGPR